MTILCPMLTALKPTDDYGQAVNRECIYEQCRFFNLEQRDCNLMLASRAMLKLAHEGAARPAAVAGAPADFEKRLTEVGKDLLHSSLEVQGVVREAGQASLERVGALEARTAELREGLARRLEETEARLMASLKERLDEVGQEVSGILAHRLEGFEQANAQAAMTLRSAMDQAFAGLAARLEEQASGGVDAGAAAALLTSQIASLTELQQRVADRLLEEVSLVNANAHRLEQAIQGLERKVDRSAEDNLQISQLVTLVKGQTEKTHAALRTINEGNRTVIQAIESQLQRDQGEVTRRRRDEALECNNRGVVLYYRGAFEAALAALQQAVSLHPEYSEAHNNLGLVLSKLGRPDEAVEAFQQALQLDPRLGEAYNNLGFLYHTSLQFDRAVEMFGKAIETTSDTSVAYTNLGNSFYKMKQPEKAVEAWRRALELDPMNENARRGLRMFQQDAGSN
ncbi:MAG: hypothetical protein DMF50_04510 [Acidobacteria bacterium]|nr:MAG: hypothetical protein DMF50_04510 [Acidobacteriota bacterium]